LPNVDVREFVNTPEYQGPTKQGIRFPWDKLAQVVEFMEVQITAIGKAADGEGSFGDLQGVLLPTPAKPLTVPPPVAAEASVSADFRSFPADFLPSKATKFVTADGGFEHSVRNESEGKFFVYAHQSGVRNLKLPTEMIHIFGTVSRYETYARELRRHLEAKLARQCGNRPLAEYQARQLLIAHGVPLL
jgi:hypothetical protein